jgi:hypothetical protein
VKGKFGIFDCLSRFISGLKTTEQYLFRSRQTVQVIPPFLKGAFYSGKHFHGSGRNSNNSVIFPKNRKKIS